MKTIQLIALVTVISFSCEDNLDLNGAQSLPEPESVFSPPSWLIGNWIDDSNTTNFRFEIDNIRLAMEDTVINFSKAYPDAHEDFKTADLYQFSTIIEDQIRIRFYFERKMSNKLDYTLRIMGSGPTIELTKR
ncbi:hypothetical protein SAMN05421640_2915 [Ekhidna lutea]|uniref:Uncharacterized protein n=1 Tax=Ekhidna lutea TaxID=447679 RepID=A0A239L2E2_EKHLU|nr:hypothetical protein [Ekhidna lutea]SNT24485.1 hypothetical protein SAMN05421640_2915 [Ekhidna lutea]